jgi:hypothetical protein
LTSGRESCSLGSARAVNKVLSSRTDEVDAVFQRTSGVIHYALVSYYRLTDEESRNAEKDLYVWFHRLARRGGAGQMPVKVLRISLLSAACQYGRSFQIWKLGGAPSADDQFNRLLQREPSDVAGDLEQRFDKEV